LIGSLDFVNRTFKLPNEGNQVFKSQKRDIISSKSFTGSYPNAPLNKPGSQDRASSGTDTLAGGYG
jgi:hypothetical protein